MRSVQVSLVTIGTHASISPHEHIMLRIIQPMVQMPDVKSFDYELYYCFSIILNCSSNNL